MKNVRLALAAVVLSAGGVSAAEMGVTDTEISIGSCHSREGDKAKPVKDMSQAAFEGANAYFTHVNEKGGVHGRKIKYVVRDDGGDPEKSVECFNQLMTDGIFAFGANLGGAVPTGKYVRLVDTHKVPAIGFHANLDDIYQPVKKYVFGAGVPWSKSIEISVDKLWADAGKRKFAIIYSNDLFGNTNLDYLTNALKKHGATLVAVESFSRDKPTEVEDQVKKAQAAAPEVVFLGGTPPSGMAVLKKAKELGFKATFIHMTGAKSFDYPKAIGDAAEGYIFPANAPHPNEAKGPLAATFLAEMKKQYPASNPEVVRLAMFMDMHILVEALRKVGKDLTRDKFVAALESMNGVDIGLGAEYKVTMSPTDHQAFDTVPFFVIKNGQPVGLKDWKTIK